MPHLRGTFEGRRFAVVAREHRKTGIYVLICFSDGTSTTVPESALVGAFEGKKFLVIDRQRVKRLWYITVQFETGEIDILDEKDVEYDEDAPLKAKSKAKK
ncbi:GABA-specific high-affinity permease [Candida albicans]